MAPKRSTTELKDRRARNIRPIESRINIDGIVNPSSPLEDHAPRASNIRHMRKTCPEGSSRASGERRAQDVSSSEDGGNRNSVRAREAAAVAVTRLVSSPAQQCQGAVDRTSLGTSLISSADLRGIDSSNYSSNASSVMMNNNNPHMSSVQKCLDLLRTDESNEVMSSPNWENNRSNNPGNAAGKSLQQIAAVKEGGPLTRLRRHAKALEKKSEAPQLNNKPSCPPLLAPQISSNSSQFSFRPSVAKNGAKAGRSGATIAATNAANQNSEKMSKKKSAKEQQANNTGHQIKGYSTSQSFAVQVLPEKSDIVEENCYGATFNMNSSPKLDEMLVVDIFRNGRPPKRKRPTISGTETLRDKLDFDEQDLLCFNVLPEEKRRRLHFVAKLKPLVSPGSTTLEYLSRIDLRKVARLMKLEPAFEYIHQFRDSVLPQDPVEIPLKTTTDADLTLAMTSSESKPVVQEPGHEFRTPKYHVSEMDKTSTPIIDCPTGLTGFSVEPQQTSSCDKAVTPPSQAAEDSRSSAVGVVDGYDDYTVERKPASYMCESQLGAFDFLPQFREDLEGALFQVWGPAASIVASSGSVLEWFVSWCRSMAMLDQIVQQEAQKFPQKRPEISNALVQVVKADRFIRRCMLLRQSNSVWEFWRGSTLNALKNQRLTKVKQLLNTAQHNVENCTNLKNTLSIRPDQTLAVPNQDIKTPLSEARFQSVLSALYQRLRTKRRFELAESEPSDSARLWKKLNVMSPLELDGGKGSSLLPDSGTRNEQPNVPKDNVVDGVLTRIEEEIEKAFFVRLEKMKQRRAKSLMEISQRLIGSILEEHKDVDVNPIGADGFVEIKNLNSYIEIINLDIVKKIGHTVTKIGIAGGDDLTTQPPPLSAYNGPPYGHSSYGENRREGPPLCSPAGASKVESVRSRISGERSSLANINAGLVPETTDAFIWEEICQIPLTPLKPISWDLLAPKGALLGGDKSSFRIGRSSMDRSSNTSSPIPPPSRAQIITVSPLGGEIGARRKMSNNNNNCCSSNNTPVPSLRRHPAIK